jgi:drug/metabolite transporter (DMT)-like permease
VPLTSLYPLVTLILAFVVLGERLTALQTAGVVLALAAGVLLSYESEAP